MQPILILASRCSGPEALLAERLKNRRNQPKADLYCQKTPRRSERVYEHLFLGEAGCGALILQPFDPGDAGRLTQPAVFERGLGVDEENLRDLLGGPAIVEQQQRVRAAAHRTRRLPAHHQKQVRPVLGREKLSAHAAERIRVREQFLVPRADFLGVGVCLAELRL